MVKKLVVGQLSTNCYLMIDKKTKEALIVDPGDDAEFIMRIISDLGAKPTKIFATHGHFDHILAAYELRLAYKIPFLMNKKDGFLLPRMQTSARYFTHIKVDPPPKIDGYLQDGDILKIGPPAGGCELEIIATPGHTPGSISLYSKKDNILFCGDLVFSEGTGRTDFAYSSQEDLERSIEKILNFPEAIKVLSGHGEETTVKKLKLHNWYNYF